MNGKKQSKKKILAVLVLIVAVVVGIIFLPRIQEDGDFYEMVTANDYLRKFVDDTTFMINRVAEIENNSGKDYTVKSISPILDTEISEEYEYHCLEFEEFYDDHIIGWTWYNGSRVTVTQQLLIQVEDSAAYDKDEVMFIGVQATMTDGTVVNIYFQEYFIFWKTGPRPMNPDVPYEYVVQ